MAKKLLDEAIVLPTKYPDLFTGLCTPWKAMLFYGPPGTGRYLINYLHKYIVYNTRSNIYLLVVLKITHYYTGGFFFGKRGAILTFFTSRKFPD